MTPEQWDTHWDRIRRDAVNAGSLPTEAKAIADTETADQFGARPREESQ